MFKLAVQQSRFRTISAYAASLIAVPATTWALATLQTFLARLEGQVPRPFGIAFLLVVAAVSVWGGSGPGLFALVLSGLCTICFLVEPFRSLHVLRPVDAVEVCIELSVGLVIVTAIQRMHRSRQHYDYLLQQSQTAEARLQTIMDVAPVGVITCDESGTLNYANREAERLWGQPITPGGPETWGRYGLRSADGKPRTSGETGLLRALQKTSEVVRDEVIIHRPDNTEIIAQANSAAILDSENRLLGAMSAMVDVTERRQAEAYREEALRLSRENAEREGLLNRIGQAQRASDNPDQVQLVAIEALGNAMSADRCCFVSVDVGRRAIEITHEWRRAGLPRVDVARILGDSDAALIDPFLHLDETFTIEDVTTNKWTRDFVSEYLTTQTRSLLLVPLLEDAVLVGVLLVAMADQPRAWTDSEVLLIEATAAQTRTSVTLAQLLQREHNIAERLQEALRPVLPESVPGLDLDYFYRPALAEASIGGDFFDIFLVRDDCVALVVGDLSGKGLAAASQIATVRNMLRFALYQGKALSEAIRGLNEVIVAHDLLQGFATLFIALYSPQTGVLTYVSCGHETALVRRKNNRIEELEPNSPILGAFEGAAFQQDTAELFPGDALLMFTDGLSEAGRSRHDFLGAEGIAKLATAMPDVCTASVYIADIIRGVEAHNRGTFHDDQCLVAAVIREKANLTVPI